MNVNEILLVNVDSPKGAKIFYRSMVESLMYHKGKHYAMNSKDYFKETMIRNR